MEKLKVGDRVTIAGPLRSENVYEVLKVSSLYVSLGKEGFTTRVINKSCVEAIGETQS
ncbi:hypothetical protein [Niabella hibiscisoli]|uniref:hypothetical protein n=1 Tax=Niabella hibiscisoli TaxID=1825928 RepID=UPI001F104EED|nr:hypothetical protein [Niabella hibiscisoli]MCH5714803.1 hypothetical protein [Niabella hibiscisoli]